MTGHCWICSRSGSGVPDRCDVKITWITWLENQVSDGWNVLFKFSVALVHRDHKDSQGGVPNSLPPSPTPPHSGGILDSLCLSVQLLSNFQLAVTTSSLGSSPAWLFFWPHCPGSFTLLQTHRHFVSATLKHKPLANTVSPTVLQSNGIRSLLTYFSPLTPSQLR